MKKTWIRPFSFLCAFSAVFSIPAWCESETPKAAADVRLVTLDPSDPNSCQQFHDIVRELSAQDKGAEAISSMEKKVCQPQAGAPPTSVVIGVVTQQVPSPDAAYDPKKTAVSLDGSINQTRGNNDYIHADGAFNLKTYLDAKNEIRVNAEGSYESDSDVSRVVVSPIYDYLLTDHWALFATVYEKHDHAQAIQLESEEFIGAMYNVKPWDFAENDAIVLSAGVGHRYDATMGNDPQHKNDLASSYRAKYVHTIADSVKLTTMLWLQHALYASDPDGSRRINDYKDYRVLFQSELQFGADKGWHSTVGLEAERNNKPFLASKKNDLRFKMGIGYDF